MHIELNRTVNPGDVLDIVGVNKMVPNPSRRWWQFWKPRMVDSDIPIEFVVTHTTRHPA